MHEMSIAMSIVDLATEHAQKENAMKIVEVELDIGTISGIEIQALNFAMEVAVKDTLLETARIKINRKEGFHLKQLMNCSRQTKNGVRFKT